jgi:hypothetical protein
MGGLCISELPMLVQTKARLHWIASSVRLKCRIPGLSWSARTVPASAWAAQGGRGTSGSCSASRSDESQGRPNRTLPGSAGRNVSTAADAPVLSHGTFSAAGHAATVDLATDVFAGLGVGLGACIIRPQIDIRRRLNTPRNPNGAAAACTRSGWNVGSTAPATRDSLLER